MFEILALILIIIAVVVGVNYMKKDSTYYEETEIIYDGTDDTPLKDTTFRFMNHYNNTAHNQRTDAIIDILHKIHFWIAIIGLYVLIKMIICIFVIATKGVLITKLLNNLASALGLY